MDTYLAAVEGELRSWPGVRHIVERRGKHRSVRVSLGRTERQVIIPTTGSDHRGPKNAVTQLRRTLRDMGATKVITKPANKREAKEAQVVARLGVNNTSVVLAISKHSPLYERFVKDEETLFYWSFELRAVADLKGTPHLAVVKKPVPTDKRHPGVAKGFVNKQTMSYGLAILRTQFKAMDRLGPFASQPIELLEAKDDALLFKLPANRQPLSARGGHHDKHPEPKPEPEVVRAETVHVPAIREPEVEHRQAPERQQPTPLVIQAPKEAISLERAINVVNAHKEKMKDNLRLSISEGGYLAVIAKFGRRS